MKPIAAIIFFIFALTGTWALGQEVDSISMTMEEGKAVVRYDFVDGEAGVDYELYLYGSHDNFSEPLKLTTGDVGKRIKTGSDKVIYWDAQQELGNFKGDFSLKIRGSKYIPFVTFKNINENFAIKRGQSFDIHWETPAKTREVKLNILRYGVPVDEAQIISNTGKHTWDIPDRLPAGKGYAIQIADAENTMHEETSLTFAVRRKIPLGYKIIPVAAVAGATLILLSDNGSNNKSGIPEPPSPPQR